MRATPDSYCLRAFRRRDYEPVAAGRLHPSLLSSPCPDEPGTGVVDDAICGVVSGYGRAQRAECPGAVVAVEAGEHPAQQSESEIVRVVGIDTEPHRPLQWVDLDVCESGLRQ